MSGGLTKQELREIDIGSVKAKTRTYSYKELIQYLEWKKEQIQDLIHEV